MPWKVADKLSGEGIELEVIDPRTLVPLDEETIIASVKRTNRLLICHEAAERGGWAGEIGMLVVEKAFDHLDAPIARVCGKNVPIPYSATLEDAVIPERGSIDYGRSTASEMVMSWVLTTTGSLAFYSIRFERGCNLWPLQKLESAPWQPSRCQRP